MFKDFIKQFSQLKFYIRRFIERGALHIGCFIFLQCFTSLLLLTVFLAHSRSQSIFCFLCFMDSRIDRAMIKIQNGCYKLYMFVFQVFTGVDKQKHLFNGYYTLALMLNSTICFYSVIDYKFTINQC